MKHKYLLIGVVIGLIFSLTLVSVVTKQIETQYLDVKVKVHEDEIDVKSIEHNNNIYIPLMSLCEILKIDYTYEHENSLIKISNLIETSKSLETNKPDETNKSLETDKPVEVSKPNSEKFYHEMYTDYVDHKYEKFEYSDAVKDSGDIGAMLKEIVSINSSETVFTSYAFLNYTGYDDMNFRRMGTVRELVREELKEANPQTFFNKAGSKVDSLFYAIKNFHYEGGDAPDFVPYGNNKILAANILRDFYVKANIKELYKKYKPYYDEEIVEYRKQSYAALEELIKRFNIPIDKLERKINVNINLLDCQGRGSCFVSNSDKYRPVEIGVGPNKPSVNRINIGNIVHEFSHIFSNAAFVDLQDELSVIESILKEKYGQPSTEWNSYDTWKKIIDESIVRALNLFPESIQHHDGSNKISINKSIEYQMKEGFILTEYFYNYFNNIKSDQPFKELLRGAFLEYIEKNK